ncbi:MAG: Ppx/GppA family phosphatase [Thermoplasmatales archaeon]|nr:Ppx/GppA family phosphatase [Thermoplasmatales archaeon]MCW6170080.1 Ppx/GppA family phosphatase [Thermoplasmatales archaeon]
MIKAVIDAGYNSFRLCTYDFYENKTFKIRRSVKEFVRIGAGVESGSAISEKKIDNAISTLSRFQSIVQLENISDTVAVGTSAFRYASNSDYIVDKILSETGIKINVVSGEEEGKFAALGTINTLPIKDAMIFDLGGGSLEVATVKNGRIGKVKLYGLGALKLKKFEKDEKKLRKEIRKQLENIYLPRGKQIVGTGGNVRALAKIDLNSRKYPLLSFHGYSLPIQRISKHARHLLSIDPEDRRNISGVNKDRSATVHVAAVVIDEFMKYAESKELMVSSYGMREGVLTGTEIDRKTLRRDWLENIALNLNLHISPAIYDSIADDSTRYGKITPYLAASSFIALTLKEFGFLNPYEMGFNFVKHSVMPGFTSEESLIVAAILGSTTSKPDRNILNFASDKFSARDLLQAAKEMKSITSKNYSGRTI